MNKKLWRTKLSFLSAALAAASLVFTIGCAGLKTTAADGNWVGTWGCAPQLTEPNNMPPAPGLSSNTLRQVVHVSIGGKRLRMKFSNQYGNGPVEMQAVQLAVSAGRDAIVAATGKALMFNGQSAVSVPAGGTVVSDPLDFTLAPLTNLTVTIHFRGVPGALTGHPGSRTTSYILPGNAVTASHMPSAAATAHWYIISGIDVMADKSSAAIVTLGDSITDGRGSTTDGNNRWPDNLARRLQANAPTAKIAVINQGIGGNTIITGGLGPTALTRFDRDVLEQSGVRWLIVFEGVNDIGGSKSPEVSTNLINAYQQFIEKARGRNIRVYGATITPFGASFYDSPAHETARQEVNHWIRSSGKFDAVIDFDAAVRDPENPSKLLPAYDTGDHLHLNVAGYQRMAEVIDLKLFMQ